jgi:hypothetical protein
MLPQPRSEWIRRCVLRIREGDDYITLSDAIELANALWDRESCRAIDAREAADRMFDGTLSSSEWGELDALKEASSRNTSPGLDGPAAR